MLGDLRQLVGEQLDGHFTFQARVFTEENLTHGAGAELADHLVVVNELFRHRSVHMAEK